MMRAILKNTFFARLAISAPIVITCISAQLALVYFAWQNDAANASHILKIAVALAALSVVILPEMVQFWAKGFTKGK